MMSFEEANKVVHKVEDQWHYKYLTEAGYEAVTKEAVSMVRSYDYVHPVTGRTCRCTTGYSSDYWTADGKRGYWSDLLPHLKATS